MAKLTPKQWKVLEADINEFRAGRLRINDHEITIYLVRSGMRMKYEVFVDGYFKGIWTDKKSEIGQAFWYPMKIYGCKPATVKAMEKILGKKRAKKEGYVAKKVVIGYTPYFSSFRSLKQVLSQHEDIEILSTL